jgi:hypothetical protein
VVVSAIVSREQDSSIPTDEAGPRQTGWLDWVAVALLVLLSAWIRIDTAEGDGALQRGPERGLPKSDPGLLYYLTSQVAHADGLVAEDWNADPRIAYPDTVDIPADYTVGQEFLLGWSWKFFGGETSLFMWCHYGAALMAALAVLGVWGLSFELCGGRWPALLSCLLYLGIPASFRTIGFVLIREDLSLTLFAIHLWLAVRAVRLGTRASVVWATGLAVLALATWHAMAFVLLLEVGAIFAIFLARGHSPLVKRGRPVLLTLAVGYLLVPSLGGAPFWACAALLVAMWLGPRLRPSRARWIAIAIVVLAVIALQALGRDGSSFGHVYEVLLAKVSHGGVLPVNPGELSFDARLLWQGPFATLDLSLAPSLLGVCLYVGIPASFFGLFVNSRIVPALSLFALASLPVTWLIMRMSCLPAILLPPLVVYLFVRLRDHLNARIPKESSGEGRRSVPELLSKATQIVGGTLLLAQLTYSFESRSNQGIRWYRPAHSVEELAQLVDAVAAQVPEGEPVASDFMSSTTILASSGHPMILQPKWEREPARRRVEDFWNAFYLGSPEGLREHLSSEYDCSYLVVDRSMLWTMHASRYSAGFPRNQANPNAGTAAAALLGETSSTTPGYRLLWSSANPKDPQGPPRFQIFACD